MPPNKASYNDVTAAHQTRRYDLALIPWVPIIQANGQPAEVGLRTLLADSHHIWDVAVVDPLGRAALRRFLESMAALIVRGNPVRNQWHGRAQQNTGFSAAEINGLFQQTADYLWLYHPRTPFLQDHRLLGPQQTGIQTRTLALMPWVPQGATPVWWYHQDTPDTGMTPAETALGLLRRWYYTLAEQRHGSRATGTSGEAHIGTPAGEGKPDITHLFWRDDTSLFRTLLFNLPQNIINPHGPTLADQTAWADPDQPRLTGDPLYVATVTGVTALLGPDNPAGRIPWMLHAPIPGTPQQVKAADEHIIQPARAQDAHRIVIHKTGRTGKLTAETVRLNPRAHRWPNLERYHRLTLDTLGGKPNQLLQGLANTQTALVPPPKSATAELLLASKSGTTMAPKYQAALTVSYRSPWLTVGQPDNDPIGEVLDVIFANRGILPMLQRAIRHSLAKPDGQLGKDPAQLARVLGDTAELHFLAQIDASVERALSQSAAGSNTWQASIPSWRDAAIAAFDTVMFPYSNTSRYVARIAQARASLR